MTSDKKRPVDVDFVKIEKIIDRAIEETDDMMAKYRNRKSREVAIGKGIFDPALSLVATPMGESPITSPRARSLSPGSGLSRPNESESGPRRPNGSASDNNGRSVTPRRTPRKKIKGSTPSKDKYSISVPLRSPAVASGFTTTPEQISSTSKSRPEKIIRVSSPTPETFYPGKKVINVVPDPRPGEKVYRSLDNSHLLYVRTVPCGVSRRAVNKVDDPRPRLIQKLRNDREKKENQSSCEKEDERDNSAPCRSISPDSNRTPSDKKEKKDEKPEEESKANDNAGSPDANSASRSTKSSRPALQPSSPAVIAPRSKEEIVKDTRTFGMDTTLNIFHPNIPDEKYLLKISAVFPEFQMGRIYLNDKLVEKPDPRRLYPELLD